jgi:hypothetical protein
MDFLGVAGEKRQIFREMFDCSEDLPSTPARDFPLAPPNRDIDMSPKCSRGSWGNMAENACFLSVYGE